MNFVDATLVRLAEPATRTALFDATALEQLVAASYNTQAMPVQGPYQPLFDEFRLGFAVSNLGMIEGNWGQVGGAERVEARLNLSGLGGSPPGRVDALWRGAIVARTVPVSSSVSSVEVAWPDTTNIDKQIIADLGALPANPAVLEQERRKRFLGRIRAASSQPAAFTEAMLDDWLKQVGATSVSDYMARFQGASQSGAIQITFSPPVAGPPSPTALPLTAALLIREANFSVAQLLMDSKLVREQLQPMGLERPRDATLRPRQSLTVVWVIPQATFDDGDWPGATQGMNANQRRAARRAAAGTWLAREGIGLVAV